MIDLARARATTEGSPAEFHCADAQEYDFPQRAFDMAISRFGVMFFGDSVGAFANIRCAMVPGGALHAIVWRGPMRSCRSEEHTSELQSLMRISYAVFCLKKKKNINIDTTITRS